MAGISGPSIVESGLILSLDAADKNSYPGTGTVWKDLSGNNNNGTLTNGPTYNNSNCGFINFDGVDDYISVPNSPSLQLTSTLTLSIWMYITGPFSGRGLITKGPASSDYDYMMYLTSNSTNISFYKKNSSGTASFTNPPTTNFINRWTNVVITFDGTNVVQYDNSVVFKTQAFVNSEIRTSTNPIRIFNSWSGAASGYVPIVQIYNRALSSTEVLQNFNANRSRFGL